MQIKLSENIRNLRKEHSLTQEQLAEAVGVSVGAVYKWEAGLSMPEIKLLMEIADLFAVSVDALLGYVPQSGNIQDRIDTIHRLLATKDFERAFAEAEKALKKYPNNFALTYSSAMAYMVKTLENLDTDAMEKSNQLFQKAISLLDQNMDETINEITISNYMATNYMVTGNLERSIEILKKNNVSNSNSGLIGIVYAMGLQNPDEALTYAKQSMVEVLNQTFRAAYAASFAYALKNDKACISTLEWLIGFLDSMKTDPDSLTHLDKFKATSLALLAVCEEKFGHSDKAKKHIHKAYELAIAFDKAPSYSSQGIRFIESFPGSSVDSFGKTACEAIEKNVFERVPKTKASRKIRKLWDEMYQKE